MKIIAASEIPPKTPFLHLGYVAADFSKAFSRPAAGVGGLLVAGSILLLVLAAAITPKKGKARLGLDKPRNRRRFRLAVIAGLVAALATSWLAFRGEWGRYDRTRRTMERLSHVIAERETDGEAIPQDIQSMQEQWGLADETVTDAWQRRVAFRKHYPHWHDGDSLVSAGTDGRFDTADDMLVLVTRDESSE